MAGKKATWKLHKGDNGQYYAHANPAPWNPKTNKYEKVHTVEVLARDCSFQATLKMTSFSHYKSAHFYFKDLRTDLTYMVQGEEMEKILLNHTIEKGLICGRWGWVKKGQVISIELLEELENDEEEVHGS